MLKNDTSWLRQEAKEGARLPAPEGDQRRGRIGALKQELSKSDNDIAKLEDHIRGLLVKSSSTMQKVDNQLWSSSATANSPWAVLQVPKEVEKEVEDLKGQLGGAWREAERAKSQTLADKLTIEDLRQKLVDATQQQKPDSELQAKLHLATTDSSEKDRMIRILEKDIAQLKESASTSTPHANPQQERLHQEQIEILKTENKGLENQVATLKRQLARLEDPDKGKDGLEEERAKLVVARLKLEAGTKNSMARQQAEGEATAKISAQQTMLAAENRCLAQQLAEAERRVEHSQDRVRALKMEVDASNLVAEDLRRKILDAQHQHCGVPSLVPNLSSAQKTQESKKAEFKASGAMQAIISPTLQTLRKQISEAMSVLCDIMTKALVGKARMEEREDFLANAFAQLRQKEQEMEERETFVCKELEMARKVADLDIENARNECNIMRKEFVDATAKLTSALSLIETLKEGQPPAQRTSRHLQPLERQLEETIEEALALKRSNDKLQARIAFMDNTISAGEESSRFLAEKLKHVEASRELERESREASEQEIARLKRGLEDLKGAKNDLDLERCLENSKHTEQIAELENERDNQFTEIAHLKQSVDDLNRAFIESEERCNLEIKKLIRLEALIKNIQTHIEACALRTQVASLDAAIKKADAVKSINHEALAEMARLEIELLTQVQVANTTLERADICVRALVRAKDLELAERDAQLKNREVQIESLKSEMTNDKDVLLQERKELDCLESQGKVIRTNKVLDHQKEPIQKETDNLHESHAKECPENEVLNKNFVEEKKESETSGNQNLVVLGRLWAEDKVRETEVRLGELQSELVKEKRDRMRAEENLREAEQRVRVLQDKMTGIIDAAQVLEGRLRLIQHLRLGRVLYSVRSCNQTPYLQAESLSLTSSLDLSTDSFRPAESVKRNIFCHHKMSPNRLPAIWFKNQGIKQASSTPVADTTQARNEQTKQLGQRLSALRVHKNRIRATQAAKDRQLAEIGRTSSARAPKIMLLTAKIKQLSQHTDKAQHLEMETLIDERNELQLQQQADTQRVTELNSELEILHLEHLRTETCMVELKHIFRRDMIIPGGTGVGGGNVDAIFSHSRSLKSSPKLYTSTETHKNQKSQKLAIVLSTQAPHTTVAGRGKRDDFMAMHAADAGNLGRHGRQGEGATGMTWRQASHADSPPGLRAPFDHFSPVWANDVWPVSPADIVDDEVEAMKLQAAEDTLHST